MACYEHLLTYKTTMDLTAHSKIGQPRSLPKRLRRITVAISWSPLKLLPRNGTEIEG
jgi:hypothetical protein